MPADLTVRQYLDLVLREHPKLAHLEIKLIRSDSREITIEHYKMPLVDILGHVPNAQITLQSCALLGGSTHESKAEEMKESLIEKKLSVVSGGPEDHESDENDQDGSYEPPQVELFEDD